MKKFLLFMFAAFTFAACEQAPIEEQSAIRHEVPESITVGFEGDDTRIQLNEAQKTVWTKDDLVSVFYRSNANQQWKYDGETGARTAELKRVDAGTATRDIDRVVVVYPYDENYYINPETYNVQASLPAVQNYLQNSYGTNGNIMISSSEYNQFSLKSVCGWLKLQIMGDGENIKSIKLRGNNGEQVAGELYINSVDATAALAADMGSADDNNAGGSLVFDDTIIEEVTLDCGEGVALGKSATMFYIALPPQTFTQGIYVAIEDTEGYVMEQSTDKALTIERNHIQPMATFEFINPATPSAPAPSTNEIWYTATAKVEPTFDDALTFGADVVSNVWDSETKRGVISFNGDVTMIGDGAFDNCDKLTAITLPEGVTTIGKKAFYDCSSLTSVTIPDSVTEIGSYAFHYCYSLTEFKGKFADGDGRILVVDGELIAFAQAGITEYTIPDSVTSIGYDAFCYCYSLTSVTIPDSVTTIGNGAFYYCDSLTSVTIGDSVTTIGGYAFCYCDSLTSVTIGDSVTTIGNDAFYYCDSLTSIIIPDSVTSIGGYAFCYCDSLKKVYCYATIPPSLSSDVFDGNASGRRIYVYEECVELYKSAWSGYKDSIYTNGKNCPDTTTIEYTTSDGNTITTSKFPIISNNYKNGIGTLIVGGTITHIPDSTFSYYDSLTSITIPDSVTSIGGYAFQNCDSLTSITIPDSVTSIGNYAFNSCDSLTSVTIGNRVTSIGDYAFNSCDSLTSVTIGDSVTEIGSYAFRGCSSLTSIIIPDSVTEIGQYTFYNCSSLTSVTIGDSVTEIGQYTFYNCSSLTSVTIGDSVTEIGSYAFQYCNSLTSVNIIDIVAWCNISFYNSASHPLYCAGNLYVNGELVTELIIPDSVTAIRDYAFYNCCSLTSATIPDSVTTIGYEAFYNCSSLTSVTIPDSVTTIGNRAFSDCISLTSITIPDSVTTIGYEAFYNCDSLTSVTIGDSVTSIGYAAFNDCYRLTSVYCKATTPPTLYVNVLNETSAFDYNGSGRKIYVPAASVEAYKSATNWSEYADAIVGYDFENGVVVE